MILLKDQESCFINGGKTTKYFLLGKDTRHGDLISASLFILVLEILFLLTKAKPETAALTSFDNCYIYPAYADDTTFLKEHHFHKTYGNTFVFFLFFFFFVVFFFCSPK